MPMPPTSWHHPSPIVFSASDPGQASGKAGVATLLKILDSGDDRPDWTLDDYSAWVFQAEGWVEAKAALEVAAQAINANHPKSVAVITNLGISPGPFLALGITTVMVECYAQAGDFPYGNIMRMRWQAKQEGWPHVIPIVGVFDRVPLSHYFDLNGGTAPFKAGHWRGGPFGIYLAEGMSDTGSWPELAALVA